MVDAKTKTVVELQNAILKTMAELVEFRDNITGEHIGRTQRYLNVLLNAILEHSLYKDEISKWNMSLILPSAQLHDVGKIAIKDGILQKPGSLTEEEFEQIKFHTVFGERVINKIKESTTEHEFLEYARIFAVSHHEKWNGSGYPGKLKGEEIPLLGRIMAIADVYDALVSERPYKNAFSHDKAVEIIKKDSGTHFDPKIVEVFLNVADDFRMESVASD
jgi:putative two-component system response regulator